MAVRGESARSNAWTARGQRLVVDDDCVERGYLAIAVAEQQLREEQAEAAQATAEGAIALDEGWSEPPASSIRRSPAPVHCRHS
jgi:hypothetical protein